MHMCTCAHGIPLHTDHPCPACPAAPQVGEAYIQLIAAALPEVAAPTEALLEVAAFPDDGICAICFNFWHKLARQLVIEFQAPNGGSGMTVDAGGGCRRCVCHECVGCCSFCFAPVAAVAFAAMRTTCADRRVHACYWVLIREAPPPHTSACLILVAS